MESGARKNFRHGFADKLARGNRRQLSLRMTQEQPHQLLSRVTGRSDDRDPGFVRAFHRAQCVFRLTAIATKDS
jgi:hypothetical protein